MGLSTSNKPLGERIEESKKDVFMQKAAAKAQDTQWEKREGTWGALGNWPQWRELGEQIRQHTTQYLPDYLEKFSDNVAKRGGKVLFAQTAEETNEYAKQVIPKKKTKKIMKSKSVVTTEVDIDSMLLGLDDISVMEIGLAEFILQMDGQDEPSHIVFPSIHKDREQIRQVFAEKLGYQGDNGPVNLVHCVREVMRKFFLGAEIGTTGCNFAIADNGLISLNTNEGNADLVISIPKTQVVLMGMEKIVPTMYEVEILDNLLARSAIGQNLTTYVTFTGRKNADESDGPEKFHVVTLDNGHSKVLGTAFQPVLQCIRCESCPNVCPAYRHIGGYGYGSIYPGSIGAVLSPILGRYKQFGELPYAFSLCGACTETCPVKTPLHELLIEHRKVMTDDLKMKHGFEDLQMRMVGKAIGSPAMFKAAMKVDHAAADILSKQKKITAENMHNHGGYLNRGPGLVKGRTDVHDLPKPPRSSENFRSWFRKHQEGERND